MGTRNVLMFGQSLLMSLVADGLGQRPGLSVQRAATWTEASRLMAGGMPDALIFDLASAGESHILPLLLKHSDLLLIGLDAENRRAVLVSRREARSLTLGQIMEYIEGVSVRG